MACAGTTLPLLMPPVMNSTGMHSLVGMITVRKYLTVDHIITLFILLKCLGTTWRRLCSVFQRFSMHMKNILKLKSYRIVMNYTIALLCWKKGTLFIITIAIIVVIVVVVIILSCWLARNFKVHRVHIQWNCDTEGSLKGHCVCVCMWERERAHSRWMWAKPYELIQFGKQN
jgi:hypothetical protein